MSPLGVTGAMSLRETRGAVKPDRSEPYQRLARTLSMVAPSASKSPPSASAGFAASPGGRFRTGAAEGRLCSASNAAAEGADDAELSLATLADSGGDGAAATGTSSGGATGRARGGSSGGLNAAGGADDAELSLATLADSGGDGAVATGI